MSAGMKFDTNKLEYNLVDFRALAWLVAALTYGAIKYERNNWRLVERADERYYDALLRHVEEWRAGEMYDSESGLPHLAHAMFCVMCLCALYVPGKLSDINARTVEACRRARELRAARERLQIEA